MSDINDRLEQLITALINKSVITAADLEPQQSIWVDPPTPEEEQALDDRLDMLGLDHELDCDGMDAAHEAYQSRVEQHYERLSVRWSR